MPDNITWDHAAYETISLPPADLVREWTKLCSPHVVDKTVAGKKDKPALSREAALFLAHLHPMLVHSRHRHCIGGIRTLMLISPCLRIGDQIPIGILPTSTPKDKLIELIQIDALLSHMAFSLSNGPAAIFSLSRKVPPEILGRLSPALADSIQTCTDLLGVSAPTLYRNHPTP